MAGILTVILILILSILITRIAAIALAHTGLSRESARFQARSAFTGVGFTTSESEKVVNHPVRRRILLLLMILGNVGIITALASLILGFTDVDEGGSRWLKAGVLAGSVVLLWNIANSKWFDKWLSNLISRMLKKHTSLNISDYANLLHLSGEYRISEMNIQKEHWLEGKTLRKSGLRDEGVIVLAITRKDGTFLGVAEPDTEIKEGDSLILYGRGKSLGRLEARLHGSAGTKEHEREVREQESEVREQKIKDKESDEEEERPG